MISTDQFLDRLPSSNYNCFDFTREVWLALTGTDLTSKLLRLTGRFKERKGTVSGRREFERLKEPCTPCVVFMQRRFFEPHVGIWINGRVLHLKDNGVQFQPLPIACGYYKRFSYYK
jgi:hypothetical protein